VQLAINGSDASQVYSDDSRHPASVAARGADRAGPRQVLLWGRMYAAWHLRTNSDSSSDVAVRNKRCRGQGGGAENIQVGCFGLACRNDGRVTFDGYCTRCAVRAHGRRNPNENCPSAGTERRTV